jgi:hypothetical protein
MHIPRSDPANYGLAKQRRAALWHVFVWLGTLAMPYPQLGALCDAVPAARDACDAVPEDATALGYAGRYWRGRADQRILLSSPERHR